MQGAIEETFGRDTLAARLFDLRNLAALAGFAAIDAAAATLGARTSNQQAIARKRAAT